MQCHYNYVMPGKETFCMEPNELTRIRKHLGLSPTQMAKAMGVSYPTYKDWQSGRRNMSAAASRCVTLLKRLKKLKDTDYITNLVLNSP